MEEKLNLDRLQFEAVIGFMKDVIPDNGDESFLFVSVENDVVTMTGGTKNLAKKATLINHLDVESFSKVKKTVPKTFMIPKSALSSFETLMKKHKAVCKKLSKGEPSYMFIQVTDTALYSQLESVDYPQPARKFEDMSHLFEKNQATVSDIFILSGEVENIMKGFKKSKNIKVTFCNGGESVHFRQDESDYEVFYILPPEEEKPTMGGDE